MNRYLKQILFANIGEKGQNLLQEAHVLMVGAGALGSANAEMLTRAGIGKLTLIDRDYVEWSNLQRQSLYTEEDAQNQLPKVIAAKNRLSQINHEVEIEARIEDVTAQTIEKHLTGVDLILDATDNFETRFIINDAALKHEIPWIYGGCAGSYGIMFTILPGETPCLNCLLQYLPFNGITCDTMGILSPTVQMVAAYQISETLKILVKDKKNICKKLISFNLWNHRHTSTHIDSFKNEECPSCGPQRSYPYLSWENTTQTLMLCGRETVQIRPGKGRMYSFQELSERLKPVATSVIENSYLLSFTIDPYRFVLFQDGRVLIHGVKDVRKAKALYHQYLG